MVYLHQFIVLLLLYIQYRTRVMYTQLLLMVTCTLSCYSGLHVHSAVTQGYTYTQLLLRVTRTLSCYSGLHVHSAVTQGYMYTQLLLRVPFLAIYAYPCTLSLCLPLFINIPSYTIDL